MDHIFDYHKRRMESIAPVFQLTKNLGKRAWNEFGVKTEGDDIKLNLMMIVLEIIYAYQLSDDACTLKEIALVLSELSKEYGLTIKGKETKFAEFIIDTFTMSGKGESLMQTSIIDPVSGSRTEHFVSFIMTRQDTSEKTERTLYMLSRVGMNFFLGTSEVYENLMFSIEQIRIREEISRKNYGSALSQVLKIRSILLNYKETAKAARRAIAKDITGYAEQEYRAIHEGINETLNNAHKDFDNHLKVLKNQKEQFIQNNMKYDEMSEDLKKQLKLIDELKENISKCNELTTEVLRDISSMSIDYIEASRKYATIRSANRISIEQDIMNPIRNEPYLLGEIWKLLHPMFIKEPDKIFNPCLCCMDQTVIKEKEPDEKPLIMIDPEGDVRQEQAKKDEKAAQYIKLMNQILMLAKKEEGLSLKELVDIGKKNAAFRKLLCQDRVILTETLIFLLRTETRHVSQEIKNSGYHLYEKDTAIGSYMELIMTSEDFKNADKLIVKPEDGRVSFKDIQDKEKGLVTVVCNNRRIYLTERKDV